MSSGQKPSERFATFAPCGPHLVTMDEVGDPHEVGIRLRLNGETMQDSSTRQMIFRAEELLAYLSQVVTLQPGDLIALDVRVERERLHGRPVVGGEAVDADDEGRRGSLGSPRGGAAAPGLTPGLLWAR